MNKCLTAQQPLILFRNMLSSEARNVSFFFKSQVHCPRRAVQNNGPFQGKCIQISHTDCMHSSVKQYPLWHFRFLLSLGLKYVMLNCVPVWWCLPLKTFTLLTTNHFVVPQTTSSGAWSGHLLPYYLQTSRVLHVRLISLSLSFSPSLLALQ